ncbi:degenerin-like protein unc-105 isoform X2 [Mytilus edulis]|uniref:degenerin-like protein unc-105 isoform X2 n=1 Tax=Mytilus edulis TaxID=6550 RepID=UPI0039F1206E
MTYTIIPSYTLWRSTRYGNCYTFEFKTDVGIMDGLDGGINLIFNLEIHENTTTDFEPGIRFVVHPRGVVAMPHGEGITIKGGERAIIGITQTGIHRLQTPNSPCRTNDRHFGGIYDMKACRKLCRETIIQEECGCYEFDESISLRTPSIVDTCKNTNFDCFKRVQGDLALNLGNYCDCPVACRETNLVLSDVREPAFKSNSLDDRSELNMMSNHICGTIYGAMPQRNCPLNRLKRENTLTENFVKIKLYFKEPAYDIWSEEAAYDQIQMLADIGGSLGLFIGASVLSLGELLEVVGMCVRALIRRRQNSIHTVDQIQETQPEKLTLDNIDSTNDIVETK